MKNLSKWIIGAVVLVAIFALASEGLQYFLKGSKMPFNAIMVTGDSVDVDEAKELYKDDTKYTKDYKGKMIVKEETTVADDGTEVTYTTRHLLLTKDIAKEMLKDNLFRTNIGEDGSIETEVLKDIPNIDSAKNIFFDSDYNKDKTEVEVKGVTIPAEYGSYSWIGYIPMDAGLIIVDDETYNSFEEEEIALSLIRFNKEKLDLRNPKDKAKVENKLSGILDNIDLSYIIVDDK